MEAISMSEDTECTPPLSQEMIAGIQRVADEYQRRNSAIPAIKQRPGESHWTAIQRHLSEEQVDRWGEFNLRLQLIRGIEVQAVGAALSGGRIADVEYAYNRLRDMIDALIADGARR
jgi:hypothetical protein